MLHEGISFYLFIISMRISKFIIKYFENKNTMIKFKENVLARKINIGYFKEFKCKQNNKFFVCVCVCYRIRCQLATKY